MAGTKTYVCVRCTTEVTRRLDKRKKQIYCSKLCSAQQFRKDRSIPKPEVSMFSGNTRLIQGIYIVNEEYYDWLSQWQWHTSDTGYAVFRHPIDGKKQTIRMHRLVIGAEAGQIIDHINRYMFDNTIANLRIATQQENARNTDRYDNAKNYTWDASKQRYMVRINKKFIGRYRTEIEAINKVKELK